MDVLLASLYSWHRLLVAYAVVMGMEAPLLLFVATVRRRPWYERVLALLPAGGFALALYLARSVRAALTIWWSHATFQETHYPPVYWPSFAEERRADLQALVASATRQGWAMGALAVVLLTGGWMLLLLWLPPPRRGARAAPAAPPHAGDEQESLDLWFERIENERR